MEILPIDPRIPSLHLLMPWSCMGVILFQLTPKRGVSIVESDIAISYDGVPFILHDPIFARTTNVADVFPDRSRISASLFNSTEIKQLDAGSWFGNGVYDVKG